MSEALLPRDKIAVGFALLLPSAVTLIYFVLVADWPTLSQQSIYWSGKTLQFIFPVVWVRWIQRQALQFGSVKYTGIIEGIIFGLLVVAGMFALYLGVLKPWGLFDQATGRIVAKVQTFGVGSFATFMALGAFYSLIHSFLEEYYWRWFVFGQLSRLARLPTALVVSSIGFMAHHVIVLGYYFGWTSPLTVFFSLSVAVGGLVWAWLYHRTQSIFAPWLSHLIVDAGIFLLGYDLVRGSL